MSRVLSPRQVWGAPALLGALSLVGLVAALVADGPGDVLSWVVLAVPVGVSAWGFRRRSRRGAPAPAAPAPGGVARPLGPRPRA